MFIILVQCQELKLAFIVFISSYFFKKILLTKKCKKRVRINKMEEVLIDKMPFFFNPYKFEIFKRIFLY